MAKASRGVDFDEELEFLDGKAGLRRFKVHQSEKNGRSFPALDFDTAVEHLERHDYKTFVSPNGGTKDVQAEKNGKEFQISLHQDGTTEITFMLDVAEIDSPSPYVEKPYRRIIGELMEREEKLQTATSNYIENFVEEADNPVEKLEQDFRKAGDSVPEIVSNYFGDMRPNDLFMNYSAQFELYPHENISDERADLPGKIPLGDSLKDEDKKDRNSHYIRRFMKNVLKESSQRYDLSEDLQGYWMELAD